jgi:hypothetical protein
MKYQVILYSYEIRGKWKLYNLGENYTEGITPWQQFHKSLSAYRKFP